MELKSAGSVLIVGCVLSIGIALLGTNPLAPSGPSLGREVRIAFASFGVLLAVAAILLLTRNRDRASNVSSSIETSASEEAIPQRAQSDPLLLRPNQALLRLSAYEISFSDECVKDLQEFAIGEADLLRFVEQEFVGHANYFLYDLEDYVLPVRAGFLVFLDKVGSKICTRPLPPVFPMDLQILITRVVRIEEET